MLLRAAASDTITLLRHMPPRTSHAPPRHAVCQLIRRFAITPLVGADDILRYYTLICR